MILDPIERRHPDLPRLRKKMERIERWLYDHGDEYGSELWHQRQDAWFSCERKYRRLYDAEERAARLAATPTQTEALLA